MRGFKLKEGLSRAEQVAATRLGEALQKAEQDRSPKNMQGVAEAQELLRRVKEKKNNQPK